MENLLLFMRALEGNSNFVWLAFFVMLALVVIYIATLVNRGIKRAERLAHEQAMEQKRIDSARGIVPIKPREMREGE